MILPRCSSWGLIISLLVLPVTVFAAENAAETKPSTPPPAPQVEDGYLKLGFEQLASYPFTPPAFDPTADPKAKPPTGEEDEYRRRLREELDAMSRE